MTVADLFLKIKYSFLFFYLFEDWFETYFNKKRRNKDDEEKKLEEGIFVREVLRVCVLLLLID